MDQAERPQKEITTTQTAMVCMHMYVCICMWEDCFLFMYVLTFVCIALEGLDRGLVCVYVCISANKTFNVCTVNVCLCKEIQYQ
jgi:hypothetical protein